MSFYSIKCVSGWNYTGRLVIRIGWFRQLRFYVEEGRKHGSAGGAKIVWGDFVERRWRRANADDIQELVPFGIIETILPSKLSAGCVVNDLLNKAAEK